VTRAISAADRVGISSISVWELGMLVRRNRLTLDRGIEQWVRDALSGARPGPGWSRATSGSRGST
jgi:PIN domain nuclease of toxin-antitoxin system